MDKNDLHYSSDFLQLLLNNQMRIYAFILSLVRNYDDADDLMQDTANTMWQKYSECQPIRDFVSWGIQVAYYKILDYRKKQNREIHVHFNSPLFEKVLAVAKTINRDCDDRMEKLKNCLKQLGPRAKKFIELRYYQDLKPKQISVLLGISVFNVYKVLSRIHSQLVNCVKTLT